MSKVQQLELAVKELSAEERAEFRSWYAEYEADLWDQELEADIAAGKLDWLAKEAREDLKSGNCNTAMNHGWVLS